MINGIVKLQEEVILIFELCFFQMLTDNVTVHSKSLLEILFSSFFTVNYCRQVFVLFSVPEL